MPIYCPITFPRLSEDDIDSLFTSSKTTALVNSIAGLDDFEPISFLVIQNDRKI